MGQKFESTVKYEVSEHRNFVLVPLPIATVTLKMCAMIDCMGVSELCKTC